MKRLVLVVVILLALVVFSTGCSIYIWGVCPSIQEETHPQILGTIYFCELLQYAREWAPLADYRWMKSNWYDLTSKADIEWVLSQIGPWACCMHPFDVIDSVHSQPGYEKVPFGYIKYQGGTIRNVAVYKDVTGQIRAFLLIDGEFLELISDPYITEIVI